MANYPGYQMHPTAAAYEKPPVVVQMSGNSGVNLLPRDTPRWSWCSMVWAMISTCLCQSFCGVLGLLCAMLSYTDHKSGDFGRARYKRRWSWCCSITGIIIGLLIIAAILVVIFVFGDQLRRYCPAVNQQMPFCY